MKTFKEEAAAALNPAMTFISKPEPEPQTGPEPERQAAEPTPREPEPQAQRYTPHRREAKTRRMQILVKPSTYERLREKAEAEYTSLNDLINNAIEEYLSRS